MMQPRSTLGERNGFKVALDVVIDPPRGFWALKQQPSWLAALLVVIALICLGAALRSNAQSHMVGARLEQTAPHDASGNIALPQPQRDLLVRQAVIVNFVASVIGGVANIVIYGVSLIVVTAIFSGHAQARSVWAIAVNSAIVGLGLPALIRGVIITVRGPDAFRSAADFRWVLPNLAWVAPEAPVKLASFLAAFHPFSVWMIVLIGYGLTICAGFSRTRAFASAVCAYVLVNAVPLLFATPRP